MTWWEEGGKPMPAWRVTVVRGEVTTNFYFQTEHGATLFRDERRMG